MDNVAVASCSVTANNLEDWAYRAEHWFSTQSPGPATLTRQPLVLTGHGMRLRINGGALEVRSGFTHYPQRQETWRFFRGDRQRPTRIVLVDGSGAITLDVLSWLNEQDIPLIQVDFRGRTVSAFGRVGPEGDQPQVVQAQHVAALDNRRSLSVATWLVREKLIRAREVAEACLPHSQDREGALRQLSADILRLERPWRGELAGLLGVEGKCAELYFKAWQGIPLSWKGAARRPVPPEWQGVLKVRSSMPRDSMNRASKSQMVPSGN